MHLNSFARLGLAAAVPLSSLILFACGGGGSSKKVAVDDWVDDLCDAAITFDKASDKAGETFLDADLDDTKKAKAAFKESVEEQKKAQDAFRDDFNKIGQPDIDGGDKVVAAFKEQFKEHDKLTGDVAKAVADIDDDDDFLEEFLKIADDFDTPDFREKLSEVAEDHDDVQDLIDKIDEDEDCSGVIFDQPGADDTSQDPTPTAKASAGKTATPSTGAPKTANEKWVAGVCTAMTGWVKDIEDAQVKLDKTLDTAADAKALKQALVDFMKTGQAETKNLQKDFSALKAPDVKDGAAIQKTLNDGAAQLVKVFDNLVADAEKVGTSSLAQTERDVTKIADGIGTAFADAGETFDKLDSFSADELDALFDSRPECQELK